MAQPARVRIDWTPLTKMKEELAVDLNTLRNSSTYQEDMDWIAEFMRQTAVEFIEMNKSIDTGKMVSSMKAEVKPRQIRLWNDAKSKSGYPYPRSIEYGFRNVRTGTYVQAKPFLRPTLKLASELSKNRLENTMLNVLKGRSLNPQGKRAKLGFGDQLRKNASQRAAGRTLMKSNKLTGWSVYDRSSGTFKNTGAWDGHV